MIYWKCKNLKYYSNHFYRMVSPPAIQAKRKIILRTIALLKENNKMTYAFLSAVQDLNIEKPRERWWRKMEHLLVADRYHIYSMFRTLGRQLRETY